MQPQRGITSILLVILMLVVTLTAVFYLDQREGSFPIPIPLVTPSPISTPSPERDAASASSSSPTLPPTPIQETRSSPRPSPVSEAPNPTTTPIISNGAEDAEGKFCGGIAANFPENQCPEGYTCKLDGNYPDAGGKCVKS